MADDIVAGLQLAPPNATDEAAGDYGWELDNIRVQGITNTPFLVLVAGTAVCRAR